MWWPDVILIFAFALLAWGFYRTYRRQRDQIDLVEKQRQRAETEEKRVFDFLHGIGEALSTDTRTDDLFRLIVEGGMRIAEAQGGAIYVVDKKGSHVRRGFGSPEHSIVFPVPGEATSSKELLSTFLRWHTVTLGEGIIGAAWRDGRPQVVSGEDPRLPHHLLSSVIVSPLNFSGQFLGVLFLTRRAGVEPFLQSSLTVFRSIADQAGFALYSSSIFHEAAEKRRIDQDLAVAHEIQRILLPTNAPDVNGYQIAGINVPARQVSGDYYDYVKVDDTHCGVAIADVSGKGVPASLIMAMCRSVLRSQAATQLSPAKVLHAVNSQLYPDIKEDMFISMAYAILDRDSATVTLCRAGHDAPLLFRAKDRTVSRINPPGMAVGIDSGTVFNRVTGDFSITLEPNDCLILYTDGITEAVNVSGDEFGMQRVVESVVGSASEGAAQIITRLTDEVRAFIGPHAQQDDITLIAIRKK